MMKNKHAGKRSFSLSRLFRNSKFILILSVVLAIVIWVGMSLSDTNESQTVVTNIPIQVNLSDEAVNSGLQIFSGLDQKASVTVTGNRVALGSVSADDIVVSAQTSGTITTSGNWTLSLTARKANSTDNFEITSSVSPSVITVFVDNLKEETVPIENKIKYNVSEGYHAVVTLSSDEVTITGPKTEIDKIDTVAIEGEIKGEIKEDVSGEYDIKLYDNTGTELTGTMYTLSEEKIKANFSVLPEKKLPVKVDFVNKPSGLDMSEFTTLSVNSVLISAPQDVLDKLTSIPTEKVDFSKLNNHRNKLELELELPDKCTDLSDTDKIEVTLDLGSFRTRRMSLDSFDVVGLDDKYSATVSTNNLTIMVKGEKEQLDALSKSDFTCKIDASDIDGTTGSISLPAKISINSSDANTCWIYGEYTVNVSVTAK